MGQYWMLLNYDKRISSGHLGKLGEFWSSGTGNYLFQRLIVPAEPLPSHPIDESTKGIVNIGEWAGDRMICVGDYIGDCPPDAFSEDELKEVEANGNLYQLADYRFRGMHQKKGIREGEMEIAYPEGRSWVLRNLSKKLFVLLDEFQASDCGDVEQILLSHICWSTDPSSSMLHDVTRGTWAGDRFDITLIENVLDGSEGPWKDVTEEVIEKVKLIWDSENRRPEESMWMMQKAIQAQMERQKAFGEQAPFFTLESNL
ncbi:hypothetical protein BDN72DRAFT_849183 [Pluteus cervinus]|uniref:Uncharacterized protein n=1 Tax=Pluteus cervinus TaxID=181527 RepID=A0ACD3A8B8_9AGAR|nr:hypothetical protein BDN72DRAFT_849183 [Pluteus cervinus]